ncbi:MAG: hypothetical protein RR844_04680, partial [Clostridium sp.]
MKKLMKKIFTKDNCKTLVMLMLLATFINLIIECFNRASLFKGFGHMLTKPQVFFYNVLVILITLSITFLTKRR